LDGLSLTYQPTNAAANAAGLPFSTFPEACEAITTDASTSDVSAVCRDASSVTYFRRIPNGGGVGIKSSLPDTTPIVTPFYAAGGNNFWAAYPIISTIRRARTDGTMMIALRTWPDPPPTLNPLGIDTTHLFIRWTTGAGTGVRELQQIDLGTGAVVTLHSSTTDFVTAVASDGASAFFILNGRGLFAAPKGVLTASPRQLAVDSTVDVVGGADAASVYYGVGVDTVTGATTCSSYRAAKIPKAGGTEVVLASGTDSCFYEMVSDANVVVWRAKVNLCTTTGCSPVWKVAK
jgi:hypothetical protein